MTIAAATSRSTFAPSLAFTAVLLGALTIIRTIGLHYSAVDLFFDESQYWSWSRELAFGYFSKPPLLAWIIAGSSAACGDTEACVRAASPLLYFGTSLVIYALAEEIYDDARTGFWAALTFTLLPGVVFSTRIISTDVPLLFCWALALLAYVKLLRAPDWRETLQNLYGNEPNRWSPSLKKRDRMRVAFNAFTRLRFCTPDGAMDFKANGGPDSAPPGYLPWFDAPGRRTEDVTLVFGHWAALGLMLRDNVVALDSGCVWGNQLSAVRLTADPAQRTVTQVQCEACRTQGGE